MMNFPLTQDRIKGISTRNNILTHISDMVNRRCYIPLLLECMKDFHVRKVLDVVSLFLKWNSSEGCMYEWSMLSSTSLHMQ